MSANNGIISLYSRNQTNRHEISMNIHKYEETIRNIIEETIRNELTPAKSCKLFFFSSQNTKSMVEQIKNRNDLKLIEWEILHQIFLFTALKIQKEDEKSYPTKNAADVQINNFAIAVSEKPSKYFSSDHTNEIAIPLPGATCIKNYLNRKELPNVKFILNNTTNTLNIILAVHGPLISGGQNEEAIRINNLIQGIFAIGVLLDFFNITGVYQKLLDLEKATLINPEEYSSTKYIFSDDVINLSKKISLTPDPTNNSAEEYFNILKKLLSNHENYSNILYALNWYCMSLDFNDIKTMFICRYISFEALSGVWTKPRKKDFAKQNALKIAIPALLAKGTDDLNEKQELLKNIIKTRNQLFHGDKNNEPHDKFDQKIRRSYFNLGILFKERGFKNEVQHDEQIVAKCCRLMATLTGIEVANGIQAFDRGRKIPDRRHVTRRF